MRGDGVLERLTQLAAKQDETFKLTVTIDKALATMDERHNAFGTELTRNTKDIEATDTRLAKFQETTTNLATRLQDDTSRAATKLQEDLTGSLSRVREEASTNLATFSKETNKSILTIDRKINFWSGGLATIIGLGVIVGGLLMWVVNGTQSDFKATMADIKAQFQRLDAHIDASDKVSQALELRMQRAEDHFTIPAPVGPRK